MKDAFGVEISKGVNYLALKPPKKLLPTPDNLNRSRALSMRKTQAFTGSKKAMKQGQSIQDAKRLGRTAKQDRLNFLRRSAPSAASPKDQMSIYGTTLRNSNKRRKLP